MGGNSDGQQRTEIERRKNDVKDRIALSDIISADIRLEKRGKDHFGLCPFHGETTPSFTVNDGKQMYHCFGCAAHGDHFSYLAERKGFSFMQALRMMEADAGILFDSPANRAEIDAKRIERQRDEEAKKQQKAAAARGLWLHAVPMRGTPAQAYLEGRGIDFAKLGKMPGAIRYRHDAYHLGGLKRKLPAMVTAVIDLSGKHVATHCTYLEYRAGGWHKAAIETNKATLGSFKGAVMPIHKGICQKTLREIDAGTAVYVSEGIEDALTVAMMDPTRRVLAAGTLDKIGSLILPRQAGNLVIVGQHDKRRPDLPRDAVTSLEDQIGLQQAQADAQANDDGEVRRVQMLWPSGHYKDFNDQLRGMRMDVN